MMSAPETLHARAVALATSIGLKNDDAMQKIEAALTAERELCAKIADGSAIRSPMFMNEEHDKMGKWIANHIRAGE